MKFFEPIIEKDYECINAINSDDYEIFRNFNGGRLGRKWAPIMVRRGLHPLNAKLKAKESDFPWLASHALVLTKKAAMLLSDILSSNGELLPLLTEDGGELFVFNSRVVDALDEEHSLIKRLTGSNKILLIKRAAFIDTLLQGVDIFRLPHASSPTYVSENFVNKIKGSGLVGLRFKDIDV